MDFREFFARLFDTSDFPPRWQCGHWTPLHGWLHILSDLGIWSAYFAIPVFLVAFILRRHHVPFRKVFVLFGAFILLCGTTHLMEAVIFWWPLYRVAGGIKLLTAVVSWVTVAALIQVAPRALAMRSPEELEREIVARQFAEEGLRHANADLERRVAERTAELTGVVAALQTERELLRITLGSIGDGVIVTDNEGRVTFLNAVAESLTGWTTGGAKGEPLERVFDIVDEDSRARVETPLRALAAGPASRVSTCVGLANHTLLIAKDGTERPIDDSTAPIRDAAGLVNGAVLVFRDVTERRRQEQELRSREREFRTLAESIPQLAWMANPDGHITWYNQRFYDYTGTTFEQMQGWGWQAIHDPQELPKVLERWRESLATGRAFDMVFPLAGRDGEFRPFLTRVMPVTDEAGRITRWFGTNTDVSEVKRAEQAVRESERRLRFVMDSMPQKIFTARPNGDVDYVNPFWTTYTGLSVEQIRDWGWTQFVHPEDRDDNVRVWRVRALAAGEPYEFEQRFRRADGEYRWHISRAVPWKGEGGEAVMWVGTNTDIHEQRQAANELRRLAAELSEADRRKDEFLATLAHELRNPLAPIRNGLQLMKLSGGVDADEEVRAMMDRQLTQLVRLVDDLMDVSRISRGRIELRRERVPLAAVLRSAVETSRPLIEQMGHEFTVTLPEEAVVVNADLTRLAQVFLNLLNNAAKYSRRGGHIRLTAERQGGEVVVSVRDTGIGICADQLPRVFEMFTQIDGSLEMSQGGLGIGLTLVKRLVEMHGGTVEARSEGPGRGSEFVVRLPVVAEAARPRAAAEGGAARKSSLRVLIVDDNRDGADSLAMMLKVLGHDTRTAYDGLEGVALAQRYQPAVVLLDIGLPKLNGYEACRRIREQPWGRGLVLIAVTGWGQDEDRRRSREAGFDHHLVKPVDPAELVKLLHAPRAAPA